MKTRHLYGIILTIFGIAVLTSCSSSKPTVDASTLLAYCKEPNTANLENLSKNYGTVINKSRKTGLNTPGIYSDYAVTLVKQGKRAEANSWFNREMSEFPSSRGYVMQLKRTLIPEYINDNSISVKDASTAESDSLPPEKRAAAEKRAASVLEGENGNNGNKSTKGKK